MNELHLLLPGDFDAATGGTLYDRRIIAGLTSLGWVVQIRGVDASFPAPTATALADAQYALAAIADDTRVLIDGLALAAMPQIAAEHRQRLRSTISRRRSLHPGATAIAITACSRPTRPCERRPPRMDVMRPMSRAPPPTSPDPRPRPPATYALRPAIPAMLLARLFESLPLVCSNCGVEMHIERLVYRV